MEKGVFLARLQPLHNGHMEIIKKMYSENDEIHIFIGSSDKKETERNPISFSYRRYMLELSLQDVFGDDWDSKIFTYPMRDWSSEEDVSLEWGNYLYYNIVSRVKAKEFKMYSSENPEEILKWFDDKISNRIDFVFSDRDKIYDGISATNIRRALEIGDMDYVKKYCPKAVVDFYPILRKEIIAIGGKK